MHTLSIKEKIILPGTWRYLGQKCPNINPSDIPIAGNSFDKIGKAIGGDCYKIGRSKVENVFVVIKGDVRFLYVRPRYTGYRTVANKVFSKVYWKVDFDHALSKRIALKASPEYKYVLLLRVPPRVNRQHGSLEKKINSVTFHQSSVLQMIVSSTSGLEDLQKLEVDQKK
jgi:hypothetical protein